MILVHFYGSLKVLVCQDSGAILAVQNKLTGMAAQFSASPAYIAAAVDSATRAFESQYLEA